MWSKKRKPEAKPSDTVARYLCNKVSWRGTYKRVFVITTGSVMTQAPEPGLAITNTYMFSGSDPDIDSISLGSTPEDFTISARQDSKVGAGRMGC